jgi:hypothetical protein
MAVIFIPFHPYTQRWLKDLPLLFLGTFICCIIIVHDDMLLHHHLREFATLIWLFKKNQNQKTQRQTKLYTLPPLPKEKAKNHPA